MTLPNVTVEIAFETSPDDPSPVWEDVSDKVNADSAITITRGRGSEDEQIQPSVCRVTLDNTDGRFTPANTSSPYYPNVKLMRRIRVRATHNSVTYDRFTGYVTEWPVVWPDGSSSTSTVTITAVSRQSRVGARAPFRSIIEEEILPDDPTLYYLLNEDSEATKASNSSSHPFRALTIAGSGSAVTFGDATGPGTDGYTAATFANGKYLRRNQITPIVDAPDKVLILAAVVLTAAVQSIVVIDNPASDVDPAIALEYDSGKARGTVYVSDVQTPLVFGSTSITDGELHVLAFLVDWSGAATTMRLYVDGVEEDSNTAGIGLPMTLTRIAVGQGLTGSVAHVAVFQGADVPDATQVAAYSDAMHTGFAGESSDARIERLARYAGYDAADVSTEAGNTTSVAAEDIGGKSPIEAMQNVVDAEDGMLFDGRDGALTFHARSHRWSVAATVTLDADSEEVGADLSPTLDNSSIVNDVTITTPDEYRVHVTDDSSITDYGLFREERELLLTSEEEVDDRANWRLYSRATPAVRVTSVSADVVNSSTSQTTALLELELGDKLTLDNLPAQAPASSMDLYVEGYTETIGSASYDLTLNTSPAAGFEVWTVEDSVFGQYDAYPLAY